MSQKYKYALCTIQTITGIKDVIVALMPEDKLTKTRYNIFHYYNGYEEFLEAIVTPSVFVDPDDFSIKAVNTLIKNID